MEENQAGEGTSKVHLLAISSLKALDRYCFLHPCQSFTIKRLQDNVYPNLTILFVRYYKEALGISAADALIILSNNDCVRVWDRVLDEKDTCSGGGDLPDWEQWQ